MPFPFRTIPRACAAALACAAVPAHAQIIDDIDVRRVGADVVLQIRFTTEVQFQRALSTRSNDLTLISYSLVTTTNADFRGGQGLRLGAKQGLPDIQLADEAEQGIRNRRLVLRFAEPVRVTVRSGPRNQSIEVVLAGRGAALPAPADARAPAAPAGPAAAAPAVPPTTPATLPEPERRFVITLQSSASPELRLDQPVPRSLQDYALFTDKRVVDGAVRHEINLGYFATRTQAEAVLRQLQAFPKAEIALVPSALPPVVAAAPAAAPAPAPVPAPTIVPSLPAPPAVAVVPPVVVPAVPPLPSAPAPAAAAPAVAAAPPPVPLPAPATAVAPAPAASAPAVAAGPAVVAPQPPEPPKRTVEEIDREAATLLATARAAFEQRADTVALARLTTLLDLPSNVSTREAQDLIGRVRLRMGDAARARIEFETYLSLYPDGPAAARIRRDLAALQPRPAPAPAPEEPKKNEPVIAGSTSLFYYGGNGRVRSQDFQDSPVAGVPQLAGDPLLTSDKSSQLFGDADVSWRRRDAEQDLRFVARDSYTRDLERPEKSRNRLSALYGDYKSITGGWGLKVGRQSPTGGGVMGRFDGVQGYLLAKPRFKFGAVVGEPTDRFFESKRRFYGASADMDNIVKNLGAGVYAIQQTIDGYVDRRALGLEARYFEGGASAFAQFDYDLIMKAFNIAAVQGTIVMEDNTVFNALYDRRALQLLALGNALTFPGTNGTVYTRIADRLATTTIQALREQIKLTTPFISQTQVGVTKPLNPKWQLGTSVQVTSVGAIPKVPDVAGFEDGRPATGRVLSLSGQIIGLNLYSARDTHVFAVTALSSPSLDGLQIGYNNSSVVDEVWQVEPSLQFYRDENAQGGTSQRWTPGLRATYRGFKRWSLETGFTYELGKSTRLLPDPNNAGQTLTTRENSTRVNYSLGGRYEF